MLERLVHHAHPAMTMNTMTTRMSLPQIGPAHLALLGHDLFTADPQTGETLWYHFDSIGFPPDAPGRGRWEGTTLTLTRTTARGTARHRFTVHGDRLTQVVDVQLGDATDFTPFLRGHYRREVDDRAGEGNE